MKQPILDQIDLVMHDLEAGVAFYRALGLDIPDSGLWRTATGLHHVDFTAPSGIRVHFDSAALAAVYNEGWRAPRGPESRTVLTFHVESREEVDRVHAKLAGLGHRVSQPPFDAFWGARYAIVCDPDGNHVGIMSPPEPAKRVAPPNL